MRRLLTLSVILGLSLGAVAMPVSAAPGNAKGAEVIDLDCGVAGTVSVLVQFNSSGVSLFDASLSGGRTYVLSSIDGRFYAGEHAVEPAGPPAGQFIKTWGKRNGYSQTWTCSAGPFVESGDFGTFTGFFDVVISGK